MDRLIRQITEQLFSRLPEPEDHFRIQNLDEYGFPPFIIRRIHIELTWNLDESMILPETDWANTESDSVRKSWQQFLCAIHAEVQLPASYARAVIETAVSDVVEILVQPRKNIPEILFGGEEKLSADQVAERSELLVVYPHFARILTSYMERKGRPKLERSRCKEIVGTVDAKVTSKYTPLQWAQMLDPLFTLAGSSIDTNIFRLFFEDKNRLGVAHKFDSMGEQISRATFIEVLSAPELLNAEGFEPDQSEHSLAKKEEKPQSEEDQPAANDKEEDSQIINPQSGPQSDILNWENLTVVEKPADEDDAQSSPDKTLRKTTVHEKEKNSGVFGLNEDDKESTTEEAASLNDIYLQEDTDPEPEIEAPIGISSEIENPDTEVETEEDGENGISAIWQRFMSTDEEQKEQNYEQAAENESVNIGTEAKTFHSDDAQTGSGKKESIKKLLEDKKNYYIDELFGGSEQAYDQALHKIAMENDWKWASQLIRKNIFERHAVDIYSDPAIDFTDRLQTYFLKKKNQN